MGEASCPKATIVVPVYNSARSIQRCLDSLLVQSECSIQVVCVNDGSTDDSLNVLRRISQADDRVLVIDQENAGVSCARNAGIDVAEGETVFFVDADDYIDAQTVECVLHAMESADAEAAVFGGVCEPADAAPRRVRQLMSPKAGTFGARDPQLLFHSNAQPYACRAAFSRELLNREDIRFAPGLAFGRGRRLPICGLCACPQDRRHAGQVLPLRDGERIGDARVQQCRGSCQKSLTPT